MVGLKYQEIDMTKKELNINKRMTEYLMIWRDNKEATCDHEKQIKDN